MAEASTTYESFKGMVKQELQIDLVEQPLPENDEDVVRLEEAKTEHASLRAWVRRNKTWEAIATYCGEREELRSDMPPPWVQARLHDIYLKLDAAI